ncbi:hypothetical protein B6A27_08755 [Anoxybacillus sp. UARK-01]|nr:hypothetical protein B6A27_08755 [Anoxybacillus sp. UARK-01]
MHRKEGGKNTKLSTSYVIRLLSPCYAVHEKYLEAAMIHTGNEKNPDAERETLISYVFHQMKGIDGVRRITTT